MGLEQPGELTGSQNEKAAKQPNNRDSSRPTLLPRPDEPRKPWVLDRSLQYKKRGRGWQQLRSYGPSVLVIRFLQEFLSSPRQAGQASAWFTLQPVFSEDWDRCSRYQPVRLSAIDLSVSGGPMATTRPPASPPSGPRSITQSAAAMTSRLCSMTTTVLPMSTRRSRMVSRRSMSAK